MQASADAMVVDVAVRFGRRRLADLPLLDVLVVDDDLDAARLLTALLRELGHRVTAVHSGREALGATRRIVPEAVLLDIGLPDVDGYETAQFLRRDSRLEHTLLIAVTGWGRDADQRAALRAGFDMHLTKPVGPKTLCEALAWVQVTRESFRAAALAAAGEPLVT